MLNVILGSHLFFTFFMFSFFFFNDTATTEIYTLSLHDALPTCRHLRPAERAAKIDSGAPYTLRLDMTADRKSTRLNSSHRTKSYAVFCLKNQKKGFALRGVESLFCQFVFGANDRGYS